MMRLNTGWMGQISTQGEDVLETGHLKDQERNDRI
jgi:hypothetical protein